MKVKNYQNRIGREDGRASEREKQMNEIGSFSEESSSTLRRLRFASWKNLTRCEEFLLRRSNQSSAASAEQSMDGNGELELKYARTKIWT